MTQHNEGVDLDFATNTSTCSLVEFQTKIICINRNDTSLSFMAIRLKGVYIVTF